MQEISSDRVIYLAANGHRMVADKEDYDRGRTWNAQHAEECTCHGEALPDW
jgi:hypothetical protein